MLFRKSPERKVFEDIHRTLKDIHKTLYSIDEALKRNNKVIEAQTATQNQTTRAFENNRYTIKQNLDLIQHLMTLIRPFLAKRTWKFKRNAPESTTEQETQQ